MIAIIPARGGSKGLPGKNTRPLLGKPLIAYTIEAAKAAACISRVIVSTDDEAIARTALEYGAEVPFMRPAHLAGDDAKAIDTYIYTIGELSAAMQAPIQSFAVLLPTCPLRTAEDIDAAYKLFNDQKADSVISYTPEQHPVSWHRYLDDNGKFEPAPEENALSNRQHYRPSYYPNGAIYVFSTGIIMAGKYYTENSFAYIMPAERSVDIDTLTDFELAEFYLKRK